MFDLIIIGGGAAGFYAAIHAAENDPNLKIAILERGKEVLAKVKVSGGGRCNVTHAQFDPAELVKNYPRGEKELLGPFYTYCSGDVISFFEEKGIALKIEDDGRMFPTSNSSQTIIDCFLSEVNRLGIQILKHSGVTNIAVTNVWEVTSIKKTYQAKKLLIATGSSSKIWTMLTKMGHSIVDPVPSLFTFNINDPRIEGISGVSTQARVAVYEKNHVDAKITIKLRSQKKRRALLTEEGPLLITHWGMSGPAILRLSAWGARLLKSFDYKFEIHVNWLPDHLEESIFQLLNEIKAVESKKTILRTRAVDVPRRLWTNLVRAAGILEDEKWADITKSKLQTLAEQLTDCKFTVDGKSTFKEEFVTAGGIELSEINFKTMESKIVPNLYFAGEVINIDAITGGFNFQNAWTTGYIAAQGITQK
ncbi:NAD(P)/FAD-dependent oxidoreductase [Aurantibacter crassamenti]|uniref:NAD(P)/FAD-dependent oxidoreductase n=1 Tax=Aurantibacter crassamenti TaxID=1837375 RepID=UPI00193A7E32|nr:NAD(P)/FAD-dependent oxidoreductase [Aurantibacter crassamenti]MBM1104746.1 NAD(P)/FAD-dependent oxidoreductase [Aurantibacter crassamenti]